MRADADFDRVVAERGVEEMIRAAMAELGDPRRAPPELKLRWKPLGAEVSADGTLGWTYGNAVAVTKAGEHRVKYLTVLRGEGDGAWRVVADIGAAGDAEPGAGP